MYKNLECQNN